MKVLESVKLITGLLSELEINNNELIWPGANQR